MAEDGKRGQSREPLGLDEAPDVAAPGERVLGERPIRHIADHVFPDADDKANAPPGVADLDELHQRARDAELPNTVAENEWRDYPVDEWITPLLDRELNHRRLELVEEQLESVYDSVIRADVRALIKHAALVYALWLELDDQIQTLGLSVDFSGGIDYPGGIEDGVGQTRLDGIRVGIG